MTVVVVTRTDPPFRLGRLRVRGQLTEVRGADLRFDPGDAVTLLGAGASALSAAQVATLCERTEGWAAGLVLAGPLNWLTGQRAGPVLSVLLGTWEDRDPPSILVRAHDLAGEWARLFATLPAAPAKPANDQDAVSLSRVA